MALQIQFAFFAILAAAAFLARRSCVLARFVRSIALYFEAVALPMSCFVAKRAGSFATTVFVVFFAWTFLPKMSNESSGYAALKSSSTFFSAAARRSSVALRASAFCFSVSFRCFVSASAVRMQLLGCSLMWTVCPFAFVRVSLSTLMT